MLIKLVFLREGLQAHVSGCRKIFLAVGGSKTKPAAPSGVERAATLNGLATMHHGPLSLTGLSRGSLPCRASVAMSVSPSPLSGVGFVAGLDPLHHHLSR